MERASDDLRRAFVAGAQWWEYQRTWATMWPSDRNKAEAEAERRFPGGRPNTTSSRPPELAGLWDQAEDEAVAVNRAAADDLR